MSVFRTVLTAVLLAITLISPAQSAERFIIVASTTSTENSGLFAHLLPSFEAKYQIQVRVIAKGTGQAIEIARRGDADVLFVHHKPSELAFVAEGYGLERLEVMFNDYVLVGPDRDPAAVGGKRDTVAAFKLIAGRRAPFLSRGDESGTHRREQDLWRAAGIDPRSASGGWYREAGAGMGAALNIAAESRAYILSDRGTWLSFGNKRTLKILVQGGARLINRYSVILVNPAKYPHVRAKDGQLFIDWLLSPEGQSMIADFRIGGEQAFFPNASP